MKLNYKAILSSLASVLLLTGLAIQPVLAESDNSNGHGGGLLNNGVGASSATGLSAITGLPIITGKPAITGKSAAADKSTTASKPAAQANPRSQADTQPQTSTTSSLEDSLLQLQNARNDASLSQQDRVFSEITARENIISEVLNLSLKEVTSTRAELNSLPAFATTTKVFAFQNQYLNNLNYFYNFFYTESLKLNLIETSYDQYSETTNTSLKNLAAEIANFRESRYDNSMNDILNFYLVYYSQSMISAANTQLNAISQNISQLEAGNFISQGEFDQQINEINTLLQSAADLTAAAKEMILYPQTESASTSTTTLNVSSATSTPITATPSQLVTQSLSDVKQAYGIFLDIGMQLRNILIR